jgi:hypothetical protein
MHVILHSKTTILKGRDLRLCYAEAILDCLCLFLRLGQIVRRMSKKPPFQPFDIGCTTDTDGRISIYGADSHGTKVPFVSAYFLQMFHLWETQTGQYPHP